MTKGESQWYRVEFDNDLAGRNFAKDLIMKFTDAWREAGMPADADSVWYGQAPDGRHVYYFSPEASTVAKKVLSDPGPLQATPGPKPSLDELTKIPNL